MFVIRLSVDRPHRGDDQKLGNGMVTFLMSA
jgi:hypothetical protein